jgi:hypothetical protein
MRGELASGTICQGLRDALACISTPHVNNKPLHLSILSFYPREMSNPTTNVWAEPRLGSGSMNTSPWSSYPRDGRAVV